MFEESNCEGAAVRLEAISSLSNSRSVAFCVRVVGLEDVARLLQYLLEHPIRHFQAHQLRTRCREDQVHFVAAVVLQFENLEVRPWRSRTVMPAVHSALVMSPESCDLVLNFFHCTVPTDSIDMSQLESDRHGEEGTFQSQVKSCLTLFDIYRASYRS